MRSFVTGMLVAILAVPLAAQEMGTTDLPIGPRDALEIRVFGLDELDRDTRVLADGTIELPLIGAIRVAGLTVPRAESEIERRLRDGAFVIDPQVSIFVRDQVSRRVSVQGAVAEPGVYRLVGGGTLVEMLAAAGGLSDEAGRRITVRRADGEILSADAERLLVAGDLEGDVRLAPGDTVVVAADPLREVLVSGEVVNEGPVVFRASEGLTVLRAVTAAGGARPRKAGRRVTVVRRGEDGAEERLRCSLEAIQRGDEPDLVLVANDLVIVGR